MIAILLLAILTGMSHALETDHVAAVSSLIARHKSRAEMMCHGLTWGAGHTLSLFLFASVVVVGGRQLSPSLASGLEGLVGVMLIFLGSHVLWRLWRDKIHFHAHKHGAEPLHFHAHSHKNDNLPHQRSAHQHDHHFQWRPLLVGMTHGMAGSAALTLLAASEFGTPVLSLAYVLLFGLGSLLGMVLVTAMLSVPIALTAQRLTMANRWLQFGLGSLTIIIGSMTVYRLTAGG